MPSFRISVTPSRRAAARNIENVRRALLKALAEENERRGLTQSDVARTIGVHRSVVNRELRGRKDITLGRVGELAYAMGREIVFDLPEAHQDARSNTTQITQKSNVVSAISTTSGSAKISSDVKSGGGFVSAS